MIYPIIIVSWCLDSPLIRLVLASYPGRLGGETPSPPTRPGYEARLVLELKLVYCWHHRTVTTTDTANDCSTVRVCKSNGQIVFFLVLLVSIPIVPAACVISWSRSTLCLYMTYGGIRLTHLLLFALTSQNVNQSCVHEYNYVAY